jgi:imidazolonepropionase-like amidohydrolase
VLFGTDVGYLGDASTEAEFQALAACGLTFDDLLRALTTAPAARFGVQADRGALRVGQRADLALYDADPSEDVTRLGRPWRTVRGGHVSFERASATPSRPGPGG